MITELINSFINVRNKVKQNDGNWVDVMKRQSTQSINTWLGRTINTDDTVSVMSSFGKKVVIEAFEYSTKSNVYPVLYMSPSDVGENYTGNLFHVISDTGRGNATPYFLDLHGSTYLDVVRTNSGNKVTLKRPIELPNGCFLGFKALETGNVTYKLAWSETEGDL